MARPPNILARFKQQAAEFLKIAADKSLSLEDRQRASREARRLVQIAEGKSQAPSAEEPDQFDIGREQRKVTELPRKEQPRALFELATAMCQAHPPEGMDDLTLSLEGKMTLAKAKRTLTAAKRMGDEVKAIKHLSEQKLNAAVDALPDMTEEEFNEFIESL